MTSPKSGCIIKPNPQITAFWCYFRMGLCLFGVFLRGDTMRKENVRCPMCGTMNYDVDLDETGGWTKCRLCKAVTCSMDEWKKHTVSVPLLNEKQLVARSMIRK